jgi:hypothetical protein
LKQARVCRVAAGHLARQMAAAVSRHLAGVVGAPPW